MVNIFKAWLHQNWKSQKLFPFVKMMAKQKGNFHEILHLVQRGGTCTFGQTISVPICLKYKNLSLKKCTGYTFIGFRIISKYQFRDAMHA